MKLSLKTRRTIWGYIFVSPWIVGTALLFAWPLGRVQLLGFQKLTDLTGLQAEWVGLENYREIFTEDVTFLPELLATMRDLAIDLPLILVFSLVMALLLAGIKRGQMALRAIFFLPVVIGSIGVITLLTNAGVDEEMTTAALQPLLATAATGESGVAGLISPVEAIVSRLTVIIWHSGVQILLFIAGLNSIPPSLYEAAYVDGATGWEAFWKITLPMLSPIILVAAIYGLVDSFTAQGNTVVAYILDVSIRRNLRLEYGAAMGMLYFMSVFLVILLVAGVGSRFVFYAGERQ